MKNKVKTIGLLLPLFSSVAFAETETNNLVVNGNFESKANAESPFYPTDWTLDQGEGSKPVNIGKNGIAKSYCLKLNTANQSRQCGASQEIAVNPEKEYTFKCYAWYSGVVTNDKVAFVEIKNADTQDVLHTFNLDLEAIKAGDEAIKLDDETIMHSFDFKPSCENIELSLRSGGIDKIIRFDNVELAEKVASSIDTEKDEEVEVEITDAYIAFESNVDRVDIVDMAGRLVLQANNCQIVDTYSLAKGTYVLKVKVGREKVYTKKFLK